MLLYLAPLQQQQTVPNSLALRDISGNRGIRGSRTEKAEGLRKGLDLLYRQPGTPSNPDTYASLLRQCANAKALFEGKRLHAHIKRHGNDSKTFLGNLLVHMYGNCGSLEDARAVFDRIRRRNAFSWNIMIAAYAHNGHVTDARDLFDKMPERNVVSWTTMIAAYSQKGHGKDALKLFQQMGLEGVIPNKVTFICVLDACASLGALEQGRGIHGRIVDCGFESDVVVGNALVNMYGKCGCLDDARKVFDKMTQKNLVSWTTIIAAYTQNGHGNEALQLFRCMDLQHMKPDKITFICVVDACASLTALAQGKKIHARIADGGFESDVFVGNALINMYGKCGSLDDARKVFDKMCQRDVVSWTAIIAAYAQNGNGKEALELFQQMDMEGINPNKVTFTCILDACATLAALVQGKGIHANIIDRGFESDVVVGTALVNMYGKCGSLDDARSVFDKMSYRNAFSWNAMIAAYAQNGDGKKAIELSGLMNLEGVKPDKITFISILFACCHTGLQDDGWHFFVSMSRDYGIKPTVEHYGCMIDLIGRVGHLHEAEDLIYSMPFKPDAVAWMTLLGACRLHGDVDQGACVAKHFQALDPTNAAPYLLLCNIYAAANRWDDASKLRKTMEDKGVKKSLGCSCIEVNDKIHEFLAGDTSHPQKVEVYAELQRLSRLMEEAGYVPVPNTQSVLHDVEEVEKEHMLCYHSEKLAIVFGLINTHAGMPLRIIKNRPVCSDCHAATIFISKIVGRRIILRDAYCFHYFENGMCSCGD